MLSNHSLSLMVSPPKPLPYLHCYMEWRHATVSLQVNVRSAIDEQGQYELNPVLPLLLHDCMERCLPCLFVQIVHFYTCFEDFY